MPNKSTKIAAEYNTYTPDPKIIEEFFGWFDGASSINEILWDMFSSSITNPACPSDHDENCTRSFLYKRLTELLVAIEPPKSVKHIDVNNN
jgi:hypothetical protein